MEECGLKALLSPALDWNFVSPLTLRSCDKRELLVLKLQLRKLQLLLITDLELKLLIQKVSNVFHFNTARIFLLTGCLKKNILKIYS